MTSNDIDGQKKKVGLQMIAHFIATVASYQNLYTVQIGLRR